MKQRMKQIKIINNQNGMALVYVLLILVVISVMGLSIMGLAANNMKMSSGERNYQSTYYIAESGITLMESQIKQTATTACSTNMTTFLNSISNQSNTYEDADFSKVYGLQPKAAVTGTVTSKDSTNGLASVQIKSKGTIGNSNRTLTKTIQIKCSPGTSSSPLTFLNDMAVFTNTTMNINATLNGKIGTNCGNGDCKNSTPITFGWSAQSSQVSIISVPNPPNPKTKIYSLPANMNLTSIPDVKDIPERPFSGPNSPYIPPDFPPFPTNLPKQSDILLSGGDALYIISKDSYYENITLQSNRTLTIDVGSEDRKIVVNKLNMEQGHIKIKDGNTGTLTLYIGDKFSLGESGDSSINKNGDRNKVKIFYSGGQEVKLGGNIKINAHVYLLNANLTLGGSGAIAGNIIAPNATQINITGGANLDNRFILAPKATVNMTNGTLNGSVVCDKLIMTGGAVLNYGKIVDTGDISFYPPSNSSSASVSINQLAAVRETNN